MDRLPNDANSTLTARSTPLFEATLATALTRGRLALPYLPSAATLLFAIGAGFAGAKLMWAVHDLFYPPPAAAAALSAPRVGPAADPVASAARLASIAPFGDADVSALDASDAPETRLDLRLTGVIAAGDRRFSRAFIASGNDGEHGYMIGARLPSGATVHSVQPDRVVLSRNGALETLRLPRESHGGASSEPAPLVAAEIRSAQANPSRLLEWMRPVAATESNTGRQVGYRVYPGRDPDRFTKLGLMPGDLVTAVNGLPLDDPARSMELLRSLGASDSITLTVERDGAQRLVQIPVLQ